MTRTACITTPIYYVNDRPHIGHIFTTTLCDAWARAMRMQQRDVFFLTGTDEHGVKVEKSAAEHNVSPQSWADTNAAEFQRVLSLFQLTNTDFIRTTQPRHERQVQTFIERLQKSGALYKGPSKVGTTRVKRNISPRRAPKNVNIKAQSVASRLCARKSKIGISN